MIKGSKQNNDGLGKFRKLLKKRVFVKSNVTAVWIDDFSNKVGGQLTYTLNCLWNLTFRNLIWYDRCTVYCTNCVLPQTFFIDLFISTEANFEKCLKPVIHDNVLFVTHFENPENIWPTIGLKWQC